MQLIRVEEENALLREDVQQLTLRLDNYYAELDEADETWTQERQQLAATENDLRGEVQTLCEQLEGETTLRKQASGHCTIPNRRLCASAAKARRYLRIYTHEACRSSAQAEKGLEESLTELKASQALEASLTGSRRLRRLSRSEARIGGAAPHSSRQCT